MFLIGVIIFLGFASLIFAFLAGRFYEQKSTLEVIFAACISILCLAAFYIISYAALIPKT